VSERIVVSCRTPYAALKPGRNDRYLDRARAVVQRAEDCGATLIAWGAVLIGLAWDPEATPQAIGFVTSLDDGTPEPEAWACGVAQGDIELLAQKGGVSLGWGDALVQANALARIARPGEVLLDQSLLALGAGELLAVGGRIASDLGRRVRAARLDVRQPWRRDSEAQIARLEEAPLIGRGAIVDNLASGPGTVAVLRADPGLGGTRVLEEVRALLAPAPALTLSPSGLAAEPLGALRRAFARVAANDPIRIPETLHPSLDRLLNGEGTTLELATELVLAHLRSCPENLVAALLIDDVMELDAASREACALAAATAGGRFIVVVRLDAMADLPEAFAVRPRGTEVELPPLGTVEGQELARASTGGALVPEACALWARRGGYSPLAVIEAIAAGLATGEIAWIGGSATARRR
jgi:hypothetical protein